jgi:hypothetical protein
MSKLFNINAGVRLPDDFVGGHEEALTYLLYEVQKQEHIKPRPRKHKEAGKDTLVWLQENNEGLWYQVSLLDECYITDQEQDAEDAEIEAILQEESPQE